MEADPQTLTFTRTRQAAELINRYVQEALRAKASPLARQMRAYRGGYLPNERREIEQELFAGKLRGVAATNALELGIDIGSLDVALLVHYPGTFASAWQQAGRSGRRHDESLAVLLAGNDPIDQFLLRHPALLLRSVARTRGGGSGKHLCSGETSAGSRLRVAPGRRGRAAVRSAGGGDRRRAVRGSRVVRSGRQVSTSPAGRTRPSRSACGT